MRRRWLKRWESSGRRSDSLFNYYQRDNHMICKNKRCRWQGNINNCIVKYSIDASTNSDQYFLCPKCKKLILCIDDYGLKTFYWMINGEMIHMDNSSRESEISLRISNDTLRKIEEISDEFDIDTSSVIRYAVTKWYRELALNKEWSSLNHIQMRGCDMI